MKRNFLLLATVALFLTVACASTFGPPTATGVITSISAEEGTITVGSNTYTLTRSSNIYAPDGNTVRKSYLTSGQRVTVWADGEKIVRINVEA